MLTAYQSVGFHHPDEHFQIIEFAGLIDGRNQETDLTWEYEFQIRPSLQPYIAFCLLKVSKGLGMTDPYDQSLFLRLLTAILSFFTIAWFISQVRKSLPDKLYIPLILISYLLWFLPPVQVRFSSEGWAGIFLLLAVGAIYRIRYIGNQSFRQLFIIGALLGISVWFRFQMGIIILSLSVWALVYKHLNIKGVLQVYSGTTVVSMFCICLDRLFYGTWTFTPFNYLWMNGVHDFASHFGVHPFYYYLEQIFIHPTYPIGVMIILSILYMIVYKFNHLLVWCVVPFIIIHSFIPHKELRFLFPVINLIPLILLLTYTSMRPYIRTGNLEFIFNSLLVIICLINVGGLVFSINKPAAHGLNYLTKNIRKTYPQGTDIYCTIDHSPYTVGCHPSLVTHFYMYEGLSIKEFRELSFLELRDLPGDHIIVLPKGYEEETDLLRRLGYKVQAESMPVWLQKMNIFYKLYKDKYTLQVYAKEKDKI